MPSSYSPLLRFEEIGAGEQSGLWGDTTNKNLGDLVEQAVAGVTTVSLSGPAGDYTLSALNGAVDESRSAVLKFIGAPSGAKNIIIPTSTKLYVVRNDCGRTIIVKTAAQVGGVTILTGEATLVFCDGTNAVAGIATAGVGPTTVSNGGTGTTGFGAGGFIKSPGTTGALTAQAAIGLASADVTGTLPVSNGGTGATGFTSGTLLVGNGGSTFATLAGVSTGQVPTWTGSFWQAQTPATGGVTSITGSNITVSTPTGNVALSLTNGNVVNALGFTPYNSNNPASYAPTNATNTWTSINTFSAGINIGNSSTTIRQGGTSGTDLLLSSTAFVASGVGFGPITNNAFVLGGTNNRWSQIFAGSSGINSTGRIICTESGGYSALQPNSVCVGNADTGMFLNGGIVGVNINATGASSLSQNGDYSIAGQGYKPGGGSWASASDARLKSNPVSLTNALAKIVALNPVSYTWKYDTTEPTVGFIAQEVKSVLPSAVSESTPTKDQKPFIADDKLLAVGFQNDMTAYLVGAIKELKAELDQAKAEIAALKAKA